ncbi:MAG TPA: hypothetical protein VHT51_20130 [Micropepsaceae bacterium]|nr:hypothetical protein [Micropepsaceae bacterium]
MFKKSLLCGAALAASVALCIAAGAGAVENGIPNFASTDSGWLLNGGIDFRPIPGKLAPVSFDPAYPQVGQGNQRGVMERMSDAENANLKPWAKELMRKYNQDVLNGHRAFSSQSRCWPGGTPGQLLFPAEPIYFIQTPKEVWIIWQRQQEVRRIYLNVPHSRNPKPSWFGESVGHYENGELVIDTIGFLDRHEFDFVDNWRTPHTKDLHVVERWKLINDGKGIEASVTVDDPGTFNAPWSGTARWQKVDRGTMLESICAENNVAFEKYFGLMEYPMPEAKAPDF